MSLVLNFDSTQQLDVYFHNRDQLFFPNRNNVFGSARLSFDTSVHLSNASAKNMYMTRLELDRQEERSLDKPGERCMEGLIRSKNVAECITSFFEGKLGCR